MVMIGTSLVKIRTRGHSVAVRMHIASHSCDWSILSHRLANHCSLLRYILHKQPARTLALRAGSIAERMHVFFFQANFLKGCQVSSSHRLANHYSLLRYIFWTSGRARLIAAGPRLLLRDERSTSCTWVYVWNQFCVHLTPLSLT